MATKLRSASQRFARVLRTQTHWLLPAEFAVISSFYVFIFLFVERGQDARIYQAATRAWLSGGDPWSAGYAGVTFAGPPVSLLPLAPIAWLDPDVFVALIVGASTIAAVIALRRLRLPAWWLLFPPLVEGITVGNPDILVLALLTTGGRLGLVAGPLAVILKVYGAVPLLLLRRWRELALAAMIALLTVPILPWEAFFAHDVVGTLSSQSSGGKNAWLWIPIVPIALVALIVIGRGKAAWWSVPVLWPSTQFHYSVLALPAISPISAALLALPILPFAPVLAVLVVAYERLSVSQGKSNSGGGAGRTIRRRITSSARIRD